MKNPQSFRLTDRAVELLAALQLKLGISKTAIVELAIRYLAKKEKKS